MCNILYFDDEKYLAKIFVKNLEDAGKYKITLAVTITEFFEKLNGKDSYDLFILDIMSNILDEKSLKENFTNDEIFRMNEGLNTGELLFEKIRAHQIYKDSPVLFYSAKNSVKVRDNSTFFLQKPELTRTINAKIRELLKISDDEK